VLGRLEAALAGKAAPTILWLHGSGCQGDSISFLNRIDLAADAGQTTVDDILINSVNLAYHTVVMSSAGETAVAMAQEARREGGYILALEGGVPRVFGGRACQVWSSGGQEVTYEQAVITLPHFIHSCVDMRVRDPARRIRPTWPVSRATGKG
jgi:Ni,Fe-hydrogenase I small subunit